MRGGANRWRRRAECDTRHVADATNDATIRPGHCVLRKRPDEPHTHPRKRVLRPGYSRSGNAGAFFGAVQRPAASPFPARSGSRLPGTRASGLRRQPGGRQPESAAHRPHAHATRHRALRAAKPAFRLQATGFPPPAFGPAHLPGASRPSRYRSESCRSRMHRPRRGRIAALARPPPAVPDGSRAWRITPPPAATCCLCRRLRPRRRRTGGRVPGLYRRRPVWFVRLAGGRPANLVPHGHPSQAADAACHTRSGRAVRHESILCSMIGPARSPRGQLRDGSAVPQNREALAVAVTRGEGTSSGRSTTSARARVKRVYPVLNLLSAPVTTYAAPSTDFVNHLAD